MSEKDILGLSFLEEFEDKINDLVVYYDLDENDGDLTLLRKINRNFLQKYYNAKERYVYTYNQFNISSCFQNYWS